MKTTLRLILPVALFATLAGCGNKGPLVHPARPADEMAVPATTAPAAPADTALPTPATTTTPDETMPPPPPPPGGD